MSNTDGERRKRKWERRGETALRSKEVKQEPQGQPGAHQKWPL